MDWNNTLIIIGTGMAVIASVYGFFKWFFNIFNKKLELMSIRFEKMDEKFDILDNRIFQLAMGKSLKEIMMEERKEKK